MTNAGGSSLGKVMELQNKEVLCACLPDSVYKKLNLVDTVISEFFYKEMQDLLPNNMMNTWPSTMDDSPPLEWPKAHYWAGSC